MAHNRHTTPFQLLSAIFSDECDGWRWTRDPFTQRELRASAALGAVLDRRAWWIQRTRRPQLRVAWLTEIGDELVHATVTQLVECWASSEHYWSACYVLRGMFNNHKEVTGEIPRMVRDVLYPPYEGYPFDDGGHFESDGEQDDQVEDEIDTSVERAETANDSGTHTASNTKEDWFHHRKANPFVRILWYVKMEVLRDRLRELPAAEWTKEGLQRVFDQIDSVDRDAVVRRGIAIIEETRGHGAMATTRALVASLFADEHREQVCELLALHLLQIRRFLDKTLRNVTCVLQIAIDMLALRSDKPLARAETTYYAPGAVPRTWLSDNAVPARLKAKLLGEFTRLASVSDAKVRQDRDQNSPVHRLIDPSLHCAVVEETTVVEVRVNAGRNVVTHMYDTIFADATGVLEIETNHRNCICKGPKYFRIPSEIDVSHDGTRAAFRSYINNLHPQDHAPLYKSLASLFVRFVPLFDQVVSALGESDYVGIDCKTIVDPMLSATLGGARPSSSLRRLVPPGLLEAAGPRYTLKGSRYQVIVQVDTIVLSQTEPRYAGEPWQVDGVDAERVLATGLYCASCENVSEPQMSFRLPVNPPRFDRYDNVGIDVVYDLHDQKPLHQEIGHVTLKEDRCLAYPSIFEHTMDSFELVDATKSGHCTLVKFLLVDPTRARVASTETIPPQQDAWLKRALEAALTQAALPDLVVSHILTFVRVGRTHEQGLDVRRHLVGERVGLVDKRVADRMYRYRW